MKFKKVEKCVVFLFIYLFFESDRIFFHKKLVSQDIKLELP